MSALLMASTTPNDDLTLLEGEYAAIRPSSKIERKRLKVGRRTVAYSIVIRSCAGVQVIVTTASAARSTLDVKLIDAIVLYRSRQNAAGIVISKSAAIMAVLRRILPNAWTLLEAHRPIVGACDGCACMWQNASILTSQSPDRRAVDATIADVSERIAA